MNSSTNQIIEQPELPLPLINETMANASNQDSVNLDGNDDDDDDGDGGNSSNIIMDPNHPLLESVQKVFQGLGR